jgi:iron complex transport system substrate-binding protein
VLPSVGTSEVPVRVVSLDLCTDWMLSHFAGRDRVKALSPLVKQYPVSWIADDWPVHDGSLEQILELEPELILTGQYNAMMLRRRLRELGLRVEILPLPQNLRDIDNYQQKFLQLLGMPVTGSKRSQAEIDNSKAARLLLLGANGIATGRNTFENDVIEQAGWQNYLKEDGYIRLDLEQVISDPPDAVLWSAPGHAALANRC